MERLYLNGVNGVNIINGVQQTGYMYVCSVAQLCPALCNTHELWHTRLLCPWNFPGKNIGVSCHFLLQGIFLTQGLTLMSYVSSIGRWILYHCATWEAQKYSYDWTVQFSSVQSLIVSDSLRPHESQHARPPCPSPSPGVHSNSRPSSR